MFRGNDKGWVLDKYTGDGLMAFYRVTGDEAGSVVQAVRGAMAMSQAAQEVSARRIQAGKQALGIGIGLHYGPAIVGLVGDPEQFNYTALGLTVVVSARLQSIAMGGEVIVSAEVYRLTSDVFRAEAGEPVSVKGLSEPVQPYRLLGELRPGIQPPPAFDLTAPTVQSNRVG
jgi:adenylate cyclase